MEEGLYNAVTEMAELEGVSKSMVMRDLIKEAMEIREDTILANIAQEREKTFDSGKALSHEEVWG